MKTQEKQDNKVNYEKASVGAKYIRSMRSHGYEYKMALAELVDNSQDAGAKKVFVDFKCATKNNKMTEIIVADDGRGMNAAELKKSFCLGADRDYSRHGNGKFGMGGTMGALALAGIKVTVTKKNGVYNIRKYDLAEVEKHDAWGSLVIDNDTNEGRRFIDLLDQYLKKMKSKSGTLVFLTNLDKMPNKNVKQVSTVLISQYAKTYCAWIFDESLAITINGTKVQKDDPLMLDEDNIVVLHDGWIIEPTDEKAGVKLKAVSLSDMPPLKVRQKLNKSGGYIYRNNRQIQSSVFSSSRFPGLWDKSQDKRDIRWALYFTEDHDDLMNVSNSKDSVSPREEITQQVSSILTPFAKHYADLRNKRDKEKTPEQLEKDNKNLQNLIDETLPSDINGNEDQPDPGSNQTEEEAKKNDTVVPINFAKTRKGFRVTSEYRGKYGDPMFIEPDTDVDTNTKYVAIMNKDHEYVRNYWKGETKEAVGLLLFSHHWALHQASLSDLNSNECEETLENISEDFSKTLRRLTKKQSLK